MTDEEKEAVEDLKQETVELEIALYAATASKRSRQSRVSLLNKKIKRNRVIIELVKMKEEELTAYKNTVELYKEEMERSTENETREERE